MAIESIPIIVIIALLFSLGLSISAIITYYKHRYYVYNSIGIVIMGGFLAITFLLLIFKRFKLLLIILFIGVVIFSVFYMAVKERLKREQKEMFREKIKNINFDEKIKFTDYINRIWQFKLLIKKGSSYVAKVTALSIAIIASTTLSITRYISGNDLDFIVINSIITFFLFLILFYYIIKGQMEEIHYEYLKLKDEEDLHL